MNILTNDSMGMYSEQVKKIVETITPGIKILMQGEDIRAGRNSKKAEIPTVTLDLAYFYRKEVQRLAILCYDYKETIRNFEHGDPDCNERPETEQPT